MSVLPLHRHEVDQNGEQWIVYTTLVDGAARISNAFCVSAEEIVESNKNRVRGRLHTVLRLASFGAGWWLNSNVQRIKTTAVARHHGRGLVCAAIK